MNDPYIGAGAGAQGYFEHQRLVNTPRLTDYLLRMNSNERNDFIFPDTPAITSSEFVDLETRMNDEMMLGLRLIEQGVNSKEFFKRYQVPLEDKFSTEINRFLALGLLEWAGDGDDKRIRLTHHGIMVANQVFMAFV